MAVALLNDIVEDGVWQGDLVKYLNNMQLILNELQADHATMRTEVVAIGTTLADIKTQFDAHTHTQKDGDSGQTSIPDDTAGGVATAGTDRVITDTSGSSVPAALSNSTALKLTKG